MGQHWIILGFLVCFSGQFGFVSTQNVCKTFGSGVMQTFNATMFHVKSTCPIIFTHFSHAGVECFISVQRDTSGFMKKVEILVNKMTTIIQDGILTVEGNSISLPYDHTYQSVYTFGIHTRLTSKVLPLSVTWYSLPEGVTSLWVQLDRPLVDGMTGMCGRINSSETRAQLLGSNVIRDEICVTSDSQPGADKTCSEFKSYARDCLGKRLHIFDQLCKLNMHINVHASVKCSFYEEFIHPCNNSYTLQSKLRNTTSCKKHRCPGDLQYEDQGAAFPPTCSNPKLQTEFRTATCLPPTGLVLNDRVEGYHSVKAEDCPCVHRGKMYDPGQKRSSKCQTCECIKGKWTCSLNTCVTPCVIESWFVTTFDGKQYSLPGKCAYVAAMGLNWTATIRFSDMTIKEIYLDVYQERYIFSLNSVQLREKKITATDLSQTDHVTVYWQSSMFVKVKTSFGMKMQVQVSPEVQLYMYLPQNVTTAGLCGSNNNNTEDDFTTSSGIVENSAQLFAMSWAIGDCTSSVLSVCINTDNEIFAEDKCSQLTNTSGVFALCHDYVPVHTYFSACVQKTCQATSRLPEHVCIGLGYYAKACTSQGIIIGDWRAETGCTYSCDGNLRFDYAMQACNRTCRSLSGPDPNCDMLDDPVEGCGCESGTHLNTQLKCSPGALCECTYPGGTTPPGPVVIDGRQCICENGILQCSDACDCPYGQICVHCAQAPVSTMQRTCASLSKPSSSDESCISGCYCPKGQFADHNGNCVTQENCTCEFSGMVYASGESVESNCKTCTCRGGQWNCEGDPCPGVCEVFGNGQYKTFDSNWYRFDGHCQYTLVEDISGLFSISAESVPCCDEALTCSRSISVKLKDEVTLILGDMNVIQKFLTGWQFRAQSLYSVHTVGLYIIISVPQLGLNVIWDKQTKVKIELQAYWNGKVRGLCGDFDGKLMNDLLTSSSTVVVSTLEFGNSWKAAVPPCSDVTEELFPCERHSYCAAWAQRRCMILNSDTFKACHLKVDPSPYYQACVLESCSCDFEGKFLGFCTAVAAYADACTNQNVCIKWRTPDLCPVYCDYYNEEGQHSWHYEACPHQIKTCGKNHQFSGKLEGCYPQCPTEMPYYDENRRICSSLDSCTCYFNNTVLEPGAKVTTPSDCCDCIKGQMICYACFPTPSSSTKVTSKVTSVPNTTTVPKSTTPLTTTNTPIFSLTPTTLDIQTGKISTSSTPGHQVSNYTSTTPGSITTKTTKAPTTISPIITITEVSTEEPTSTNPLTTTTTDTPTTTTTSTPEITTEEPTFTTSLTTTTTETPITKTTTPEFTTEEPTSLTPLTTTTTESPKTTTKISTPEITTEEPTSTTQLTTTGTPETTTTSTPEFTTEETTSTTPLSTATTWTPTTTTTTTLTPEFTTEEPTSTISLITNTTETPITTTKTSTSEITTEEPISTALATITTETPITTTQTSTPEITTEEPTSKTPLTTTTTRTQITTTTTTPEFTTEEPTSSTQLITNTKETPITTTKTSTPEITTEEPTSKTPLTTTRTPITTTTTTPEFTTEEPTSSTQLITNTKETLITTTKTSTPEITTEESTSTTTLTRTTTETPKTTTTTTPEFTTEEPTSSTQLITNTKETLITTTKTSTPEITTEEPTSKTPLTTTRTPITTTTTTPEFTTEESISSTQLITNTKETPITTTKTSTPEITTEEPTSTTTLTTTTTETPKTTTTTSTPEFTTEEPTSSTQLITNTKETLITTTKTSTPEITTEEPTSKTPLTTTRTPITTTTTTPEFTTEESISSTQLITNTKETPITTTKTSTPEITTEEPTSTTTLTTTTTETPKTTTTTPEFTTEEPTSSTQLITNTKETLITTAKTSTPEITTEEPTSKTPLTTTRTPITTTTTTPEFTTEEPISSTQLITNTKETPITTTKTSTPEITTEEPTATTTPTTTTTETPKTTPTTSTPEFTSEESTSTTTLTTTTTETLITTTKTTTPEITTEEPTSTSQLTTTETPITTTSTPQITSEVSTTMLTTIITGPITRITTLTTEFTSEKYKTTSPSPTSAKTPITKTTIFATTTAHNTACKDLNKNQTWPDGLKWTEDCFTKMCKNGVIELRPLICPTPVIPVCPRGMPKLIKDKQGCCDTWQCDCQCDVFGDPHYMSFAGQDFVFLENCTYILVEEITPNHQLSISVDNYDCEPSASCARGIIVQYQNNTVKLQVLEVPNDMPILQTTLNQVKIKPPYQAHGLRFENTDAEVYLYIEEIRSYVFLSVWNTLQINLAMENFFHNTQGQCGVCGGPSCTRRDGAVETEDCCDKTAYEWIEDDPLKPYCQQARQHVPCYLDKNVTTTTTISSATPTTSCTAPLCDLLRHQVFSECSGEIDVEKLVSNCKFDYCVAQKISSVCSPLEHLADQCKKMGFCVAWRNLTHGICDIACPEGMILDECRSTSTDFCQGGVHVLGTALDTMRSGCFCPDNQLLADIHKKICVSECTNCKGPLGEPMPVGAIWESHCHMCTCNNQTLSEECWPKPPLPTPTCSSGSSLILDCCNNQICVEKTCEYNGRKYKVGETWRDPKSPCLTHHCTSEGTEIERRVCPQQSCPEKLRVWDEHHCCYLCNTTCGVKLSKMTVENCTQEVMLPTCEGNCASGPLWVRSGKDLQLEHNQFSCREKDFEIRQISLVCNGTTATQYTYKHITSCECQREV